MKILSLHCDYIKFKPLQKAIKSTADLQEKDKKEVSVKDPLGIFVAVEKTDEGNLKKAIDNLVSNILDLKDKVKAAKIVLYPYAHLSSSLSSPDFAREVLEGTEALLKKQKIETFRAPFGYYKEFELKCKGHPLSELSREIKLEVDVVEKPQEKIVKVEVYDYKKLLASISKSKLDTSKLKENDHRILGQKLDLFSFNEVAPGMVFWHNNGLILYNELANFWREKHRKTDYQEIKTPEVLNKKLWQISGHWEKYRNNIFLTNYEGNDFAVKPMSCPGGIMIFKNSPKSYKDLPLRMSELGTVHRQELSGVLAGLFRVIQFTQDDAHIYCTEDQMEKELEDVVNLAISFYNKFELKLDHIELSTRPEKRIGSDKIWDLAEKTLEGALKKLKIKYKINTGNNAFYNPKIDFHLNDSLGRTWQCGTIQLDFSMPERFEIEYTDSDGKKKRPVMIHNAIYGSLERFIGILLESTSGNLPTWLSPIQVRIINFTDRNTQTAEKVLEKLKQEGIRVDCDFESSTVGDKVRKSEEMKIPYLITIGDKEEEKDTIALKKRGKDEKPKFGVKLEDFLKDIKKEIKERL
jgi:threonyl-tRNA synthetase